MGLIKKGILRFKTDSRDVSSDFDYKKALGEARWEEIKEITDKEIKKDEYVRMKDNGPKKYRAKILW